MFNKLKQLKIIQSFMILRGNTRVSVIFEPLWGIPFIFYNFYLSLYMKEMGITEQQFGGIIAAGFISGAFFSLFGGVVTDYLGRRKTTLIFDFISWPVAIILFLISRSFLMFIIATVVNNVVKIVAVSWNLMVVEDADSEQRKAAFNILNIINIALGIITPLAGLLVANRGIVQSERVFMVFAIVSMTIMIFLRNKYYTETAAGRQILAEHKGLKLREVMKKGLYGGAFGLVFRNRRLGVIVLLQILFNLTIPLGAFNSMFFAPFMTDHIGIDKATVSVLGAVYAGVMLFVFLVINPLISKKHVSGSIVLGLVLQALALVGVTLIPAGFMVFAILAVGLYAFGYGIFTPFNNALFADVSDGRERAGIYSLVNTVTSILSAVIGAVSGFIYAFEPRLIFFITVLFLALCVGAMVWYMAIEKKHQNEAEGEAEGLAEEEIGA
ncbi:MAG: MFS transporter [Clostridia bacterium]|nr:MFS transporter [Clostridia bacterium]